MVPRREHLAAVRVDAGALVVGSEPELARTPSP